MRNAFLGTALLVLILGFPSASYPQQGKKAKSALSSAIDASAAAGMGGAKAAPITEDGEFLRRVMLDLVGYPPNLEEVKAFIADTNPDKRSERIEKLLESPDWADRTARQFCEGWFGNYHKIPIMLTPMLDESTKSRLVNDFVSWLKLKLSKDAPYREVVDGIIRAKGTGTGDPALLWKLACYAGDEGAPVNFANRVSKHFLGIRLICAQCHDHPFAQWKTSDFNKLAGFFGRTTAKGGAEPELREVAEADAPKMSGGTNHMPQFIHGEKPAKGDPWVDSLAVFMTGPSTQELGKAVANRVWAWLFGRGLVHPVDDFNDANKPLGGGLINTLAGDLRSSKYSIKSLYRGICNSDTYQRSSSNETRMGSPNFSAGWIKHLDPEQLLNSIQVATTGRAGKSVSDAIRLVEPLFPADVVWCEVTQLPGNMRQALLVRNNNLIHGQISGGGVLSQIKGATTKDKVEEMFLAALSRKPSASELERFAKYIDGHAGQGAEDAYWTLLNTTEFLSRH